MIPRPAGGAPGTLGGDPALVERTATTESEERAALDALRRGELGGLEPLVRRYHARAWQVATAITGDPAAAEDVVVTAFVPLPERLGRYDPSRPFAPWFFRTVSNAAIDVVRRQFTTALVTYGEAEPQRALCYAEPCHGKQRATSLSLERVLALTSRATDPARDGASPETASHAASLAITALL
jgi:RNA polymerase sigma factor (sigma-70 family)